MVTLPYKSKKNLFVDLIRRPSLSRGSGSITGNATDIIWQIFYKCNGVSNWPGGVFQTCYYKVMTPHSVKEGSYTARMIIQIDGIVNIADGQRSSDGLGKSGIIIGT